VPSPIPFPADIPQAIGEIRLERIRAAAERISPYVRYTPVMYARLPMPSGGTAAMWLKLENLQAGGASQVRAVLNTVLSASPERSRNGLVSFYDGAGLCSATVHIGRTFQLPVRLFVARTATVSAEWIADMENKGAHVVHRGSTVEEPPRLARRYADEHGMLFIPPSGHVDAVMGAATLGMEMLDGPVRPRVVVVPSIGGGGFLTGVAAGIKLADPSVRVIAVEFAGAPNLYRSLPAGHQVALGPEDYPLSPRRLHPLTFELARRYVDDVVLVTPDELQETLKILWSELEVSASKTGAYAVAAFLQRKVPIPPGVAAFAVVTSIGEDGMW
jgi:threonine dehydratase